MKKINNLLINAGLILFISYLTNYNTIFGGSDFEENLGIINFLISGFLYMISLKYILKKHNKFIIENLKKIIKRDIEEISNKFQNSLIYPNIVLFISTIIIVLLSIKSYSLYVDWHINEINTFGFILSFAIFVTVLYIGYFKLLNKSETPSKYALIFTISFIFYVALSFVFVKLVVEFITTFIAVAGGGPFGPA